MRFLAITPFLIAIRVDPTIGEPQTGSDDEDPRKTLVYYPLDPIVPCGDGSPAGFYTDAYTTNSVESKGHVINFMGGCGCANEVACGAMWEHYPYMLSSLFEPQAIEGHTILSNDPIENPSMASFTKWNVPYCSQDLWLGESKMSGDFVRSGSEHVKAILDHWLYEVLQVDATIDTLVVTGLSAGTMAILNHFENIQSVAEAAGVKSLRLIMDSSLNTDRLDADFKSLVEVIVDPYQHPLCFKEFTENFQPERLSKLPCCLSTHCMLRHSTALARWARGLENNTTGSIVKDERLLLIDSAYDSLQTFLDLNSDSSLANTLPSSGLMSLSGLSSTTFNIGEFAGSRKARVMETLFGGERQISSNVVWMMTSATGHDILAPIVETPSRLCPYGEQAAPSSCNGAKDCIFSEYPFGVYQVCNSTGSGFRVPISDSFHVTLWKTTESWKRISVNGRSIQEIISKFVTTTIREKDPFYESGSLLIDSCPGPNCVPVGTAGGNSAQSLIEIDDIFRPVPLWLRIVVSVFVLSIPVLYTLSISCRRPTIRVNNSFTTKKGTGKAKICNVHLNALSVHSNRGDQILDNVSIYLESSSLNCLLGKSGSGKSTLLGVLSRQLRSNLKVQYVNSSDLTNVSCTYMRQLDLVTMENMTPNDFLCSTANIYGTDDERVHFVLGLVKPFFQAKTKQFDKGKENTLLDPFHTVPIRECSGGQRRMLAIATALFQNTSLLLLDEPLSGIDSASSESIVNLLKSITKENNVTILMTLHQPSNSILAKMDKAIVLGGGRILFDGNFRAESEGQNQFPRNDFSAVEQVHDIITKERDQRRPSLLHSEVQKYPDFHHESYQSTERPIQPFIRVWQVKPLLARLHLDCPPGLQDLLVLPLCFLAISLWCSIDSKNPIQGLLVTATFLLLPSVFFESRILMNWRILESHIWDLEDKRISCLSYLLASGIQMLWIPLVTIPVSFSIAYAIFGWQWESFWVVSLFCIMYTICNLQFGKTLCAALGTYRAVVTCYSVYLCLGVVCSGFYVNPANVPTYLRLIMFMSLSFWGLTGTALSQLEYVNIGEEQCLSFASCIMYDRNFLAHFTGYVSVTTEYQSMLALCIIALVLVFLEYYFISRKVSQRGNYETVKTSKTVFHDVSDTSIDSSVSGRTERYSSFISDDGIAYDV